MMNVKNCFFMRGYIRVKIALAVFVACGTLLLSGAGIYVYAKSTTSSSLTDTIKEKEKEIADAQSEKKDLLAGLTDVKKIKAELEKSKDNLQNYITQLDGNLSDIEKKISELETSIGVKEEEITVKQSQLETAIEIENNQYEAMKTRIQFMYEAGDTFYFETLLSAKSFGDFLNKAQYVESLSAYDRDMLDQYVANRQLIELLKQELEEEKDILETAKAGVETEKAALEDLICEKEKQITAYEYDISNKEQAIKEYEADIAAQNEIISQLEAAVAEARRKLLENNGNVRTYDGGMFKWPAPSYTRISDDYGWRMHPTLNVEKFHNGIDLAAPSGSKILAAYDGEVVAAAYSTSMGNYIMIDHGDSLYTIYMHASALYVKKGDIVVKGEHIAAVGSTGRSTGPHLHFGVRLNGEYVSPWNYISN